jgi:ubiquinol-cytochrome c reductase cytochrome c subunit
MTTSLVVPVAATPFGGGALLTCCDCLSPVVPMPPPRRALPTRKPPGVSSSASWMRARSLFLANCASCHGSTLKAQSLGPSLIGVGALSVDFQVGTGRMPMAASGPQAEVKPVQFTQPQIDAMGAWVATLAPGPDLPDPRYYAADGDTANGAELFRINCAMCHNVAGAGGALTEGKYAPHLRDLQPIHIYGAMVTGPQNMPVFSDMNLTPKKKTTSSPT